MKKPSAVAGRVWRVNHVPTKVRLGLARLIRVKHEAFQEAVMPLFFLHLVGTGPTIRDEVGLELPGMAAASYAARATLARRALDGALIGKPLPETAAIEICDERGQVLKIEWYWSLVRNPKGSST